VTEAAHPGQCRCGAIRLEASGAPLITMACHCTGCQRMTGGAYSVSSFYAADRFRLTAGATVRGGLKTGPDHEFCPECMSWMFTTAKEIEGFVNVRSTMFDDASVHRPYVEMFKAEALPGATSGAVRSYEGFPQDNEFPALIADYANWDGRVKQ
jgi:hypothetical protein